MDEVNQAICHTCGERIYLRDAYGVQVWVHGNGKEQKSKLIWTDGQLRTKYHQARPKKTLSGRLIR